MFDFFDLTAEEFWIGGMVGEFMMDEGIKVGDRVRMLRGTSVGMIGVVSVAEEDKVVVDLGKWGEAMIKGNPKGWIEKAD